MTSRRAALTFTCAWLVVNTAVAIAEESASATKGHVQLDIKACPAVPATVVRRVVSIEIGDLLLLDDAAAPVADAERLVIRCTGDFASVEAQDSFGEASTERILRLDDFPGDAAPRALALLGVELLAARSAAVRERILRRQPGTVTVEHLVPATAPPSPEPASREVRIGVAGVWRSFVQQAGAPALGGRVDAAATTKRPAFLSGDIEIARGSKNVENVGQTTALLISSGIGCGVVAGRRQWRAAVGVGARIGLVRESGTSAAPGQFSASTFVRPWGGPILTAKLSAALGPLALTMAGEAGWSLTSVDELAAGATAIAVRGPWIALSIGAELRR